MKFKVNGIMLAFTYSSVTNKASPIGAIIVKMKIVSLHICTKKLLSEDT